jgi:hypothetical protein
VSARTRALVGRPGRKTHFATLAPGETVWLSICDRVEIPVFGANVEARNDWTAWLQAAQDLETPLCSLCRRPLLVAALALHEVADVRASNLVRERLVEQIERLQDVARRYSARILAAPTSGSDAARREEERVDRRLRRAGL